MEWTVEWIAPGWLRRESGPGTRFSFVLENPGEFLRRLGRLAAPLVRCLVFANRVGSVNHMGFIVEHAVEDARPIAANRDQWAAYVLTVGTLCEFVMAIESLRRAGVAGALAPTRRTSWEALEEVAEEARGLDEALDAGRHKLAFHVDDSELIALGLAAVSKRRSAVFAMGDDESNGSLDLRFGDEALLTAFYPDAATNPESITTDMSAFGKLAKRLPHLVQSVAVDLLFSLEPTTDADEQNASPGVDNSECTSSRWATGRRVGLARSFDSGPQSTDVWGTHQYGQPAGLPRRRRNRRTTRTTIPSNASAPHAKTRHRRPVSTGATFRFNCDFA